MTSPDPNSWDHAVLHYNNGSARRLRISVIEQFRAGESVANVAVCHVLKPETVEELIRAWIGRRTRRWEHLSWVGGFGKL